MAESNRRTFLGILSAAVGNALFGKRTEAAPPGLAPQGVNNALPKKADALDWQFYVEEIGGRTKLKFKDPRLGKVDYEVADLAFNHEKGSWILKANQSYSGGPENELQLGKEGFRVKFKPTVAGAGDVFYQSPLVSWPKDVPGLILQNAWNKKDENSTKVVIEENLFSPNVPIGFGNGKFDVHIAQDAPPLVALKGSEVTIHPQDANYLPQRVMRDPHSGSVVFYTDTDVKLRGDQGAVVRLDSGDHVVAEFNIAELRESEMQERLNAVCNAAQAVALKNENTTKAKRAQIAARRRGEIKAAEGDYAVQRGQELISQRRGLVDQKAEQVRLNNITAVGWGFSYYQTPRFFIYQQFPIVYHPYGSREQRIHKLADAIEVRDYELYQKMRQWAQEGRDVLQYVNTYEPKLNSLRALARADALKDPDPSGGFMQVGDKLLLEKGFEGKVTIGKLGVRVQRGMEIISLPFAGIKTLEAQTIGRVEVAVEGDIGDVLHLVGPTRSQTYITDRPNKPDNRKFGTFVLDVATMPRLVAEAQNVHIVLDNPFGWTTKVTPGLTHTHETNVMRPGQGKVTVQSNGPVDVLDFQLTEPTGFYPSISRTR